MEWWVVLKPMSVSGFSQDLHASDIAEKQMQFF
jgi:hypothetical protein